MNWKEIKAELLWILRDNYGSKDEMNDEVVKFFSSKLSEAEQKGIQRAIGLCNKMMRTLPEPSERLSFYVAVEQELRGLIKEVANG